MLLHFFNKMKSLLMVSTLTFGLGGLLSSASWCHCGYQQIVSANGSKSWHFVALPLTIFWHSFIDANIVAVSFVPPEETFVKRIKLPYLKDPGYGVFSVKCLVQEQLRGGFRIFLRSGCTSRIFLRGRCRIPVVLGCVPPAPSPQIRPQFRLGPGSSKGE